MSNLKMYDENFVIEKWEKMISQIDKYFHRPIVLNEDGEIIREFVISEKKTWAFDILNRVICNIQIEEYVDDYFPYCRQGVSRCYAYRTNNIEYSIFLKKYLNNNTLVVIKIVRM